MLCGCVSSRDDHLNSTKRNENQALRYSHIRFRYSVMKYLLYPFALLYGIAMRMRNFFYVKGWRKSFEFDFPVINVGNLSVGGTGKTPHIEYLIRLCLENNLQPAVLSRGYGRKTYGYRMATDADTSRTIGDEPAQIKRKFPDITVVVCEKRARAVPQLLAEAPETDVILLDDAYQHRTIKPGLNLLLTSYHKPFWKDKLLPVGRLREPRREQKRADAVIVSKCPVEHHPLSPPRKAAGHRPGGGNNELRTTNHELLSSLSRPADEIYFTRLRYGTPYHIAISGSPFGGWGAAHVLLLCGVADPEPLVEHLRSQLDNVSVMRFRDHHYYSKRDVAKLRRTLDQLESSNKLIVTTEKDATRLLALDEDWSAWPLYVQPVQVEFVEGEERFESLVLEYVQAHHGLNIED